MKSAIIYYSHSGGTRKIANMLCRVLSEAGQADLIELSSLDEPKSFFAQCRRALSHVLAKIEPVTFDLSGYQLICFGTPIWAFGPAPAMNSYLDRCFGIEGKDVILFTTYGSGTGNDRCLNYMQDILTKKGAKSFKRFSIQRFKIRDSRFIFSKIKEVAPLSPNG